MELMEIGGLITAARVGCGAPAKFGGKRGFTWAPGAVGSAGGAGTTRGGCTKSGGASWLEYAGFDNTFGNCSPGPKKTRCPCH